MTRTGTKQKRRITMAPITAEERVAFLASLKGAEAEIKAGKYTEYDSKKFKDRLVRIYRSVKR